MFNADGSEAQMCGNGIRCVAKYVHDHGISDADPLRIETAAGVRELSLTLGSDGKVAAVRVDMGVPILAPARIPTTLGDRRRAVLAPIEVEGALYPLTCVSMGNPHAVLFVAAAAGFDLQHVGPLVEHHPAFPQRVNFHVAEVLGPAELSMRSWERGSGITLACGTGACAVCVAGVLTGRCRRAVTIHLPGGDLQLAWPAEDAPVQMTGPAAEVFTGTWPEQEEPCNHG
jgi:diaminopimelate epimerase